MDVNKLAVLFLRDTPRQRNAMLNKHPWRLVWAATCLRYLGTSVIVMRLRFSSCGSGFGPGFFPLRQRLRSAMAHCKGLLEQEGHLHSVYQYHFERDCLTNPPLEAKRGNSTRPIRVRLRTYLATKDYRPAALIVNSITLPKRKGPQVVTYGPYSCRSRRLDYASP